MASADDTTLPGEVIWEAPAECSEALFRERIKPTRASLLLRVHIENVGVGTATKYQGTLYLDKAKRDVESPRCDEVVRALALAGNMLLDSEPEAPQPIARRDPADAPAAPVSDPTPTPDPGQRPGLAGSAIFLAGAGASMNGTRAMPVFTITGMSTLGTKIALGLGNEIMGRFTSADVAPYTASLFWLTLRSQVCALFLGDTPFRVGPCASIDLGISHAEVAGAVDAAAQTRFWSALGPSVRAFWIPAPKRGFVLGLQVSALFPLTRSRFLLDQGPVLYATETVAPEATLSAGYTFR